MSTQRSGKSHVIAWLMAVFLGVPVLYLLSAPPVTLTNGASLYAPYPLYYSRELAGYGDIYRQIEEDHKPLREPLIVYWNWWYETIRLLRPLE